MIKTFGGLLIQSWIKKDLTHIFVIIGFICVVKDTLSTRAYRKNILADRN